VSESVDEPAADPSTETATDGEGAACDPPAPAAAARRPGYAKGVAVLLLLLLLAAGFWAAGRGTVSRPVVVTTQALDQYALIGAGTVGTETRNLASDDHDVLTDESDLADKLLLTALEPGAVVRPSQLVDHGLVADRSLLDVIAAKASREPRPGQLADVLVSPVADDGERVEGAVIGGVPVLAVADVDGQRRYTLAVTPDERLTLVGLLGSSTLQVVRPAPFSPPSTDEELGERAPVPRRSARHRG
jgi:hypothetical protein